MPGDGGGHQRVQRFGRGAVDLRGEGAAVDEVAHGLAYRLVGLGVVGVEAQVADLQAGHLDEADLLDLVAGVLLDLLRGDRTGHQVDLAALQRLPHGVGVGEGAHHDLLVLQLQAALVVGVGAEVELDDLVVLDLGLHAVRARAGDVEALADLVGRVVGLVDDAGGGGGELVGEGRVGAVEVEDDLALAPGLDGVDVGQQADRAVAVLDAQRAVDRVLDVLGVQLVPVGEGQALAELAAVPLVPGVGEGAGLGRLGHRLATAAGQGHQGLDGLAEHVPGTGVVGGGRVEGGRGVLGGGEPVGGADDDGVAALVRAVRSAAGGEYGGEQADDGRQHQCLAVHARSSPQQSISRPPAAEGWGRGGARGYGDVLATTLDRLCQYLRMRPELGTITLRNRVRTHRIPAAGKLFRTGPPIGTHGHHAAGKKTDVHTGSPRRRQRHA